MGVVSFKKPIELRSAPMAAFEASGGQAAAGGSRLRCQRVLDCPRSEPIRALKGSLSADPGREFLIVATSELAVSGKESFVFFRSPSRPLFPLTVLSRARRRDEVRCLLVYGEVAALCRAYGAGLSDPGTFARRGKGSASRGFFKSVGQGAKDIRLAVLFALGRCPSADTEPRSGGDVKTEGKSIS